MSWYLILMSNCTQNCKFCKFWGAQKEKDLTFYIFMTVKN
jgi:lipoate synthase